MSQFQSITLRIFLQSLRETSRATGMQRTPAVARMIARNAFCFALPDVVLRTAIEIFIIGTPRAGTLIRPML